ncbi:MAG: PDZ domain-containing protein, partial [Calditrichaeota bacterium]|nr:PDZ domain-containing protein [Calditrichota bacterium]
MNRSRQIIRFQFFVGSLSLLIFILFSYQMYLNQVEGRVTDENLFTTRKGKVVVIEVTEGGASDRAGMLVADTILSINGQGFDNSQDADKILRASEAGSLMDYEIKRGDQSIHLKVQAAKQRIQLRSVIGYLVILEWLALSLFLAWRRADRFAARFMSIGCMAIAPLIGANYIFQVSPPFITIILLALSIFVGSSVFIHAHFYMNVTECVNKKVSLVWIRLQYILGFIPLLYFIVLLISGVRSLTLADTRGVILFVMIAVFAAYFFGFILYQFFMTYKQQPGSKLLLFAWLVMFALPSMTGGALLNFGFNQASFLFVT